MQDAAKFFVCENEECRYIGPAAPEESDAGTSWSEINQEITGETGRDGSSGNGGDGCQWWPFGWVASLGLIGGGSLLLFAVPGLPWAITGGIAFGIGALAIFAYLTPIGWVASLGLIGGGSLLLFAVPGLPWAITGGIAFGIGALAILAHLTPMEGFWVGFFAGRSSGDGGSGDGDGCSSDGCDGDCSFVLALGLIWASLHLFVISGSPYFLEGHWPVLVAFDVMVIAAVIFWRWVSIDRIKCPSCKKAWAFPILSKRGLIVREVWAQQGWQP